MILWPIKVGIEAVMSWQNEYIPNRATLVLTFKPHCFWCRCLTTICRDNVVSDVSPFLSLAPSYFIFSFLFNSSTSYFSKYVSRWLDICARFCLFMGNCQAVALTKAFSQMKFVTKWVFSTIRSCKIDAIPSDDV